MLYYKNILSLASKVKLSNIANVAISPMAVHIPITDSSAEKIALDYLKQGSVIAVPTDTVYGLACDATNVSAINKLFEIKRRNENKPLAICLGEVDDVIKWAKVQHIPINLLNALLPGPYTLILHCTDHLLNKSLTLNGKVGIRIPDYQFIRSLSQGLGKPLALTSANLSNEPSALEVSGFSSIWQKISVVFNGGKLDYNDCASTVVDLTEVGAFQVLRKGAAYEDMLEILHKFSLKNKII